MSVQTTSLVSARLPDCLTVLVIDYFGRATEYGRNCDLYGRATEYGRNCDLYEMARLGQYEDCMNFPIDRQHVILASACRYDHLDLAKMAIANGADNLSQGIKEASCVGRLDIVEYMFNYATSHNNLDSHAVNSAFLDACEHGHLNVINFLIPPRGQ